MSRQAKNANRKVLAQQITALHKQGLKGPASTTPKHTKNPSRRLYSRTCRGGKSFA